MLLIYIQLHRYIINWLVVTMIDDPESFLMCYMYLQHSLYISSLSLLHHDDTHPLYGYKYVNFTMVLIFKLYIYIYIQQKSSRTSVLGLRSWMMSSPILGRNVHPVLPGCQWWSSLDQLKIQLLTVSKLIKWSKINWEL